MLGGLLGREMRKGRGGCSIGPSIQRGHWPGRCRVLSKPQCLPAAMYKRRDWLFTRGADGGGSDSSSDESSSGEESEGEEAGAQQP